jgi:hypothetical protein
MTTEAEGAADYVQTEAPRLIRVASVTAISFALFDGANRALMPFDPNGVAVRLDEIDDWSDHAKLVWDAAFQTFGKRSD